MQLTQNVEINKLNPECLSILVVRFIFILVYKTTSILVYSLKTNLNLLKMPIKTPSENI